MSLTFRNRVHFKAPLTGRNTVREVIERVNSLADDLAIADRYYSEEGLKQDVFYENNQVVDRNYTVPVGRNAMTAGPITIADEFVITVPEGSSLTIV